MKRILIFIFAVACVFASQAQNPKKFELTVKVNGYPEGAALSLGRYYADNQYKTDSGVYDAKRKVYVFKNDSLKEGGMYMLISFDSYPAEIIIDKDQQFSIETSYPEFGGKMLFKNSPENQIYQSFNESVRNDYQAFEKNKRHLDSIDPKSPEAEDLAEKIRVTLENIEKAKQKFMAENPKHLMSAVFKAQTEIEVPEAPTSLSENERNVWRYNYYKDHYFDNFDLTDDRLLRTPLLFQRLDTYLEKILPPHPDSIKFALERIIEKTRPSKELFKYVIWMSVDKYQRSQIIGYDAIWVYLAKKYYLGGEAFWASPSIVENFRKRIERVEPLLIGNVPPEFYCPDTNVDRSNERVRSVYEPKTRYTVVIFWEPNCGHCKKQMPLLKKFYEEKSKSLDFEVFAVCRDFNIAEWKNYIYSNGINHWINVSGKASNVKYDELWDIYSTPTIYVLDSQKRIVTKRIDVEQIEPFILNWNELYYEKK